MILVLLGTQDKSFHRLLEQIDKVVDKKVIKEEIIVQAGHTKYESKNMTIFDYVSQDELNNYIDKAELIITHAGVGSILSCIKKNKKVIAAARLKCHKEHTNDHQLQILKEFDKQGYIIPLYDFNKLSKVIEKARKFKPKKYKGSHMMIELIEDYIKKNVKEAK